MKTRLYNAVAALASKQYQEKYIANGTALEYVLPDEALDSACLAIETVLNSAVHQVHFTATELDGLRELHRSLRDSQRRIPFDSPELTNNDLVERNREWLSVRAASQCFLQAVDYDLAKWEMANH